jgi:hypothetical protein
MCNLHVDVQELLASLGEPLGSQSDSDTVQSRSLERDDDDAVSHAVYVPTALYTRPVCHYRPCYPSFNAATN